MRKFLIGTLLTVLTLSATLQAELAKKPQPAEESKAEATPTAPLPTPLPAEQFQGQVREGYKTAAEIPEVLAGLACYCGCDRSAGHRYLLDCFTDDHGAHCHICLHEALDAHALFMTGTPPDEIRTFIDHKYGGKAR